ncbi:polysaccharide biosynthesis tyrosine autokinase [Kineosporia rhizophila]|uniref:polysaccharide biosynthesis tyrosine autokinase n=1 Tax=Kineosporia TaxID=49184 RepID=UPI001E62876A|nr:polysaccharide biosynthesis tyrosine autokinase [Kineosporia sp. NBRC 101677]MCE0539069.1 polysaccharide biosynthesis tyrosine autokinase [Kineosporia rhizophila]GLY17828.1 chromosome partitioning protein [Kineosporia sp. NBRC 101677]
MTIVQYLHVLRRQWLVVLLLTALGVGAAYLYTDRQVPTYSATAELFVGNGSESRTGDVTRMSQGSSFIQQRIKSYADVVTSPAVLTKVSQGYGVPVSAGQISVTAPADTVLLDITVTDTDPARAAVIANGIAEQFPGYVAQLERLPQQAASPVRLSVIERATEPSAPVSPRVPLNLALGLLVGLGLGIGAAVLRDAMNTSVTAVSDIEKLTGAVPLGVVPFDPETSRQPLVDGDEHGARAEAFRTLRTNLQFADVDSPPRVIVITSPLPDEGKSTSACNLALTLALGGARVVLVDGDLRKPSVGRYLGVSSGAGLTTVLAGRHELREVVTVYGRDMLAVLPSGPTPPNPSELLGSQQMADLLATLAEHYDVVVVDAPPLLPVTDAAVLSAAADGAVLVIRHGRTRKEDTTRALQALDAVNAKLLGSVLNFAPKRKRGNGYDGYGYGYGYGEAPKSTAGTPGAPQVRPASVTLPENSPAPTA